MEAVGGPTNGAGLLPMLMRQLRNRDPSPMEQAISL